MRAMNSIVRVVRWCVPLALAAAAMLGTAGCAEMNSLRATSQAQARRIDELEKAQRKTSTAQAEELRRMQAEVSRANEQKELAQAELRKAQSLKSERELELERNNQQLAKTLAERTESLDATSKNLDQKIADLEKMEKKSSDTQSKLGEKADALADAQSETKQLKAKLDEAKKTADEANKKLAEQAKAAKSGDESDEDLEGALSLLKASMKPLVDADLAFVARDSRGVVVGLKADLLFDSGSTNVSEQSQPTLNKIGEIYAKYGKKYVEVQGHTDSAPVTNMPFADNWALASARADAVVRYMADQTKIPAEHLKSSSCSHYRAPEAATAGGEKMRRRVELILSSRP